MSDSARNLILITGTGRSGTSTMSGIFHHLGIEVPGPYLGANESNPKGFFESRWSVRFHNDLCGRAHMHVMDSRPTAFDDLQAVITPADRTKMRKWIGKVAEGQELIVVKDPRSVWTQQMWREEAAANGLKTNYISMLRHPAETIGSRAKYYASSDEAKRRRYEIFNIARWVHNQLVSERETRGQQRAFVRYVDLLADWRPELARLSDEFGLTWPGDLTPGTPSPVDDFVTPDLRRVQVTWDDLEIPDELQRIADEIWQAVNRLRDARGVDDSASAAMDDLAVRYRELFWRSSAISEDAIGLRMARHQQDLEALAKQQQAEQQEAARKRVQTPRTGDDRALKDVGAKELVRVIAKRALRRLPGRARNAD